MNTLLLSVLLLTSAPVAAQPLVLDVGVDAEGGTLTLAGAPQRFLVARLTARPTARGVELFPVVVGPRAVERWFVRVVVQDPAGGRVRHVVAVRGSPG